METFAAGNYKWSLLFSSGRTPEAFNIRFIGTSAGNNGSVLLEFRRQKPKIHLLAEVSRHRILENR
jgi:hypothetical protein